MSYLKNSVTLPDIVLTSSPSSLGGLYLPSAGVTDVQIVCWGYRHTDRVLGLQTYRSGAGLQTYRSGAGSQPRRSHHFLGLMLCWGQSHGLMHRATALPVEPHPQPYFYFYFLLEARSHVVQAGFELLILQPPASQVLGLNTCVPMSDILSPFLKLGYLCL